MPQVSNYTRTQIKLLHKQDHHAAEIFKLLKGEGLLISLSSVTRIIKKLRLTGCVANFWKAHQAICRGKYFYRSANVKQWWDDERSDPEEAGEAWHCSEFVHSVKILQATRLDFKQTAYCQLIRDANKVRRLEYAQRIIAHFADMAAIFEFYCFKYLLWDALGANTYLIAPWASHNRYLKQ